MQENMSTNIYDAVKKANMHIQKGLLAQMSTMGMIKEIAETEANEFSDNTHKKSPKKH